MKRPLPISTYLFIVLTSLFLSIFHPTLQAQTTRYVSTTGTNSSPASATSWATSTSNLQGAIDASASGDQVWVAGGTYKPSSTTDRAASFSMATGVSIYGGFSGSETALTGRAAINPVSGQPSSSTLSGDIGTTNNTTDNSYHVINNPNGLTSTAILDGFVISGGNADGSTNAQQTGGGLYCPNGSPIIRRCFFAANQASIGGGIAIYALTQPGSPTITHCFFQSNSATGYGGALSVLNFINNTQPFLTNCAFVDNWSSGDGSAIYNGLFSSNINQTLTLTNCSLQGNRNGAIPALYSHNNYSNTSTLTINLVNSIFWNNGGEYTLLSNSTQILASHCVFDGAVTNYTSVSANQTAILSPFVSTTNVDLLACSSAIDAGDNSATGLSGITTDLANNARFFNNSTVDIGAVEYAAVANPVITAQSVAGSAWSDVSVCAGSSVTASVSLAGTGSVTYQWYQTPVGAGQAPQVVAGQSTSALSLTNIQAGDVGSYSVVITGSCTSVTSTGFTLTLNPAVTATIGAANLTLTCGQPTVSLTASGGTTYRWDDGSTNAVRLLSNAGSYSVVVSTGAGCSASASTTLLSNLVGGPQISGLSASSSVVCEGRAVSISATITGAVTAYQWYKDGASLGAVGQSQTLLLGGLTPGQSGQYVLVVTNASCGSTSSSPFILTVNPLPIVTLLVPGNASVQGATITLPTPLTGVNFQVLGGISFERFIMLDRINGYEIRQMDSNTSGIFNVNRTGPFSLTVTDGNGCKRTVEGIIREQ